MKKLITVIALASSMGIAYANEPVALTEGQMDSVNAGGYGFANAGADAWGFVGAATQTGTWTLVTVLGTIPTEGGQLTVDYTQAYSFSSALANGGVIPSGNAQ